MLPRAALAVSACSPDLRCIGTGAGQRSCAPHQHHAGEDRNHVDRYRELLQPDHVRSLNLSRMILAISSQRI